MNLDRYFQSTRQSDDRPSCSKTVATLGTDDTNVLKEDKRIKMKLERYFLSTRSREHRPVCSKTVTTSVTDDTSIMTEDLLDDVGYQTKNKKEVDDFSFPSSSFADDSKTDICGKSSGKGRRTMASSKRQTCLDNNEEQIRNNRETLVLDAIAKKCSSSSFTIFKQMNKAIAVVDASSLNANDAFKSKLAIKVLSGGAANYSYKVFVKEKPELCVFAKLSFEFDLWSLDSDSRYDLERTENEFQMMQTFSMLRPEFVATPLYCLDLVEEDQNMKLLITEWAKGDEQFANQFIDGTIDERIAPKLADACATLHSFENFDPDFNENVKPCMENLFKLMKSRTIEACTTEKSQNRTQAFCRDLGEDLVMKFINANITNYHKRGCLVHSDFHVFNLLVEAKPSIRELENFGPNGGLTICDWEMSFVGPIGRDIGLAQSFPIGCMIAHAFGGNLAGTYNIECFLDSLWDNYSLALEKMGKTPSEMARIHRNIVGYCGWFMYIAFYILQAQVEFFPIESTSGEQLDEMIDSMGILGLKFIRFGFDRDYRSVLVTTDELQSHYKSLIKEEVDRAYQLHCQSKRTLNASQSSALRISGRRFSDADMFFSPLN